MVQNVLGEIKFLQRGTFFTAGHFGDVIDVGGQRWPACCAIRDGVRRQQKPKGEFDDMTNHKKHSERRAGRPGNADVLGSNSEIGRKLRQYYDELVSEDVPDRFAQLLQELDQAESAAKPE